MDIYTIRRIRLASLIRDRFDGNQAEFARRSIIKAPQINRWLSTKASDIRRITEDSARSIETRLGLPALWLDAVSTEEAQRAEQPIAQYAEPQQATKKKAPEVEIAELLRTMSPEGIAIMLDKARDVAREYPARTTDDARFLTGNARIIEPRKPSPQAKRNKYGKT